jgi:hypothetical protein
LLIPLFDKPLEESGQRLKVPRTEKNIDRDVEDKAE